MVRFERILREALAAVVDCSACSVLVVVVGPLRGFAAAASAVVELPVAAGASAGTE